MIHEFINYEFPHWGYIRLPQIVLTDKERERNGVDKNCSNELFLRILAKNGFAKRMKEKPYIKDNYEKYIDRVKTEIELIEDLGFVNYILLVWKVCNFCDQNGIARGFGRGSVGGSCVCFFLNIVQRDPIKDSLFFERFISKTRAKKINIDGIDYISGELAPDVDIDVEQMRRSEVIKFLEDQYPNGTSKISTLNTLSGRLLIKECGKIIEELPEQEMIHVASLVPKVSGFVADIEDAYNDEKQFKSWCDEHKEIYEVALKLRGLNKNVSCHASGIVISDEPLDKCLPLHFGSDKELTSTYDMNQVSKKKIKLDILGLRCCSVIADVAKQVGINIYDVNVDDDPIIYDNLQDLIAPQGIFQLEADTALRVTNKVKPKNINELSDILALARPGSIAYVDEYVKYKNNLELIEKIHPIWDRILIQTYNQPLYQEQTIALAVELFKFTANEGENLRRSIAKKKPEEVEKWKEKIYSRVKELNLDIILADKYWKLLDDSSKYSFNKSHSINYASISALTTYLKFKYPQNFFLALLKQSKEEPDPIGEVTKIQNEFKYFDMELLPPHLLKSDFDFKIEGKNIRFGLSSIKGISDKTIEKLIGFRKPHTSKFELFEAANECKIPIGVLSALIQAGAMVDENYNMTRSRLVLEANLWNILTDKEKLLCIDWAKNDFNYDLMKIIKFLVENNDEKGKRFIKESRFATIKKKYELTKNIYLQNSKSEKLANFFYERKLLGFSYSEKLFDLFKDSCDELMSIFKAKNVEIDERVCFVGVVIENTTWTSKNEKKTKCWKAKISDESESIDIMAFNDHILDIKESNGGMPKEDSLVIVRGIKKDGTVFVNNLILQDYKIYTCYSDLRADKNKVEISS